jgi:septum formation protein
MKKMETPELILASGSPRRSEYLRAIRVPFEIHKAEVNEWEHAVSGPGKLALDNARLKARSVGEGFPRHIVLGADTVVCLGDEIFGKPRDMAEAEQFLLELSGNAHVVRTGVCLTCQERSIQVEFIVSTKVVFKTVNRKTIRNYLEIVNPLDKAGAYAAQEASELIIEGIEGSYSNVVGLPMERLQTELLSLGFIFDRLVFSRPDR